MLPVPRKKTGEALYVTSFQSFLKSMIILCRSEAEDSEDLECLEPLLRPLVKHEI